MVTRRGEVKRSRDDRPLQSKTSNSAEILVAEFVCSRPEFDSVGWQVVGCLEAMHEDGGRECPMMVCQMEVHVSKNY